MLNVFTKSIITSSTYVSICSYAYYTYTPLLCRVSAVYFNFDCSIPMNLSMLS